MRVRVRGVAFALAVSSAIVVAAAQTPARVPLDVVLDRTAWYLDYFVDEFENVVAEETYIQDSSMLLPSFSPAGGGRGGAWRRRRAGGDAAGAPSRPAIGLPARQVAGDRRRWCRSATSSRSTASWSATARRASRSCF